MSQGRETDGLCDPHLQSLTILASVVMCQEGKRALSHVLLGCRLTPDTTPLPVFQPLGSSVLGSREGVGGFGGEPGGWGNLPAVQGAGWALLLLQYPSLAHVTEDAEGWHRLGNVLALAAQMPLG